MDENWCLTLLSRMIYGLWQDSEKAPGDMEEESLNLPASFCVEITLEGDRQESGSTYGPECNPTAALSAGWPERGESADLKHACGLAGVAGWETPLSLIRERV